MGSVKSMDEVKRMSGAKRGSLWITVLMLAIFLVSCAGPLPGRTVRRATPRRFATRARSATATAAPKQLETATPPVSSLSPLAIPFMRAQTYPGSDLVIEQTLEPGRNYDRYIASYQSDGLTIYGLLTVPTGPKPPTGWPVVIFNHGFLLDATKYRATAQYPTSTDTIAQAGYILFMPDYRGYGKSEGETTDPNSSPAYTVDVLNGLASVKRLDSVDPDRIGMWGHSMGGGITLRAMVVSPDIKAGVIWAGTVNSQRDLLDFWARTPAPDPEMNSPTRKWRADLIEEYGTPDDNPQFWDSISPASYLAYLSGPVQLHHGTADEAVPPEFSETLNKRIQAAGKQSQLYTYRGDGHYLGENAELAIKRSVDFLDKYVKNASPDTGGSTVQ